MPYEGSIRQYLCKYFFTAKFPLVILTLEFYVLVILTLEFYVLVLNSVNLQIKLENRAYIKKGDILLWSNARAIYPLLKFYYMFI